MEHVFASRREIASIKGMYASTSLWRWSHRVFSRRGVLHDEGGWVGMLMNKVAWLLDFIFFSYYFLFEKKVFKDHHVEFVFLLLVACTYTITGHVIACLPACVRNPVVVQLINSREEGETTAKLNSNHDKDGVIITSSWVLSLDKEEKAEEETCQVIARQMKIKTISRCLVGLRSLIAWWLPPLQQEQEHEQQQLHRQREQQKWSWYDVEEPYLRLKAAPSTVARLLFKATKAAGCKWFSNGWLLTLISIETTTTTTTTSTVMCNEIEFLWPV